MKNIDHNLLSLEEQIITDVSGANFAKKYTTVFIKVKSTLREKVDTTNLPAIYSEGERSIYKAVVQKFLKENPDLIPGIN